jgi:hypothetical protein
MVSRFGPQNRQLWFGDLDFKITVTISWFGPQNQADFDLLVAQQNQRREVDVGHVSRSSDLLRMEASLSSKLVDAWRWVVHMAPSWRLRRSQVEDERVDTTDYVRLCYPCFAIFILLGPRGIAVI